MDLSNPLVKLVLTGVALWGAYHYGPAWAKGLAIGAAGYIAANQVPLVRDGLSVRLVA